MEPDRPLSFSKAGHSSLPPLLEAPALPLTLLSPCIWVSQEFLRGQDLVSLPFLSPALGLT